MNSKLGPCVRFRVGWIFHSVSGLQILPEFPLYASKWRRILIKNVSLWVDSSLMCLGHASIIHWLVEWSGGTGVGTSFLLGGSVLPDLFRHFIALSSPFRKCCRPRIQSRSLRFRDISGCERSMSLGSLWSKVLRQLRQKCFLRKPSTSIFEEYF